jgi:hypothetical protein
MQLALGESLSFERIQYILNFLFLPDLNSLDLFKVNRSLDRS